VPGATSIGSALRARRGGHTARAIKTGEIDFAIAGGVESMTRAPLVMAKAESAFQRSAKSSTPPSAGVFVNP
jgi:acetyl-CoA acetyltransferase